MTCNFYELVSVQLFLAWAQCILIKVSCHMSCHTCKSSELYATYLHLSVSILVGMTTSLTLPPQFLELWLAALNGLNLWLPLTLVLLQRWLEKVFISCIMG